MAWLRKARRRGRRRLALRAFLRKLGRGTLTRNGLRVKAGRYRDQYLHRVVYRRFKGRLPRGWDVDHIDGDKRNNHPRNLRRVRHDRHPLVTFKGKSR